MALILGESSSTIDILRWAESLIASIFLSFVWVCFYVYINYIICLKHNVKYKFYKFVIFFKLKKGPKPLDYVFCGLALGLSDALTV